MLPRNLAFILKKLHKRVGITAVLFAGVLLMVSPVYANSVCLGVLFSYVIFRQFILNQYRILLQRKKILFFVGYLNRLALYATPLICGIHFEKYFNIIVILISLFAYQVAYMGFEFGRSYKKYKRQQKTWTD